MASSPAASIFLLFLLCTVMLFPSHSLHSPHDTNPVSLPILVRAIRVRGLLVCSATGNPTPSCSECHGLPSVNVTITCNGATTSVGSVLTDARGFFNAVLNLADGLLFDTTAVPCFVSVKLPVASCKLLPPTGILRAPVNFLGTVVDAVLGLVGQVACGLFVLVH